MKASGSRTAHLHGVVGGLFVLLLFLSGCGSGRLSKAETLISNGAYDEASSLIQEEILDNPSNGRAYFLKAQVAFHREESQTLIDAIAQAIKASPGLKEEIARWLAEEAEGTLPTDPSQIMDSESDVTITALQQAQELDASLIDEEIAYRWWVLTEHDENRFVEAFPSSSKLPSVYWQAANRLHSSSRSASKTWYERLASEYPESPEGKSATEKLEDWWDTFTAPLPLDTRWHQITSVKKGSKLRITVEGSTTISMGAFGDYRITPDAVVGYTGSRPSEFLSPSGDSSTISASYVARVKRQSRKEIEERLSMALRGPWKEDAERELREWQEIKEHYFVTGNHWSGVATQDGYLYLEVDSRGFDVTFYVTVEIQE
jgi:hypothetical protein